MRINNNSYYTQGYANGAADALNSAELEYTYHVHLDADGNERASNYTASSNGGCFTKTVTKYGTSTNTYAYAHMDGNAGHYNVGCYDCNTSYITNFYEDNEYSKNDPPPHKNCIAHPYTAGYSVNCGKTNASIESVKIIID